jgi:hypothetical protein
MADTRRTEIQPGVSVCTRDQRTSHEAPIRTGSDLDMHRRLDVVPGGPRRHIELQRALVSVVVEIEVLSGVNRAAQRGESLTCRTSADPDEQ